jgi:3-hydroxyacyl-CoA dehydrogenase
MEGDLTIEEADALTGTLIGLPNSASFRMLDLVGLDVWAEVGPNLYKATPEGPYRDRFLLTPFQVKMVENKWLGEKTGQGFYKRVVKGEKKEIWVLDWKTMEYHPTTKPTFPSVEAAKGIDDLRERLRALVQAKDRAGDFLWKLFSDYFLYSAEMIPEISDRIVEIYFANRNLGRDPAFGRDEGLEDHRGHQQGCQRADLRSRGLRDRGRSVRGRAGDGGRS